MRDISHNFEGQKKVLCFDKVILAFGPFLGFFWPLSGQKNPKNLAAGIFFVLPHDDIDMHFSMKHNVH